MPLNTKDEFHQRAIAISKTGWQKVVTTEWILMEVADSFAKLPRRREVSPLIVGLKSDSDFEVIPAGLGLFDDGLALYNRRADKRWSLTDCTSFVVMERMSITKALTGDHHFQQAGFEALFL